MQTKLTLGLTRRGTIRGYQCTHHATIYTIQLTIIIALWTHKQNCMAKKRRSWLLLMGGTEVRWREEMKVGPRRTNKGNSERENRNDRGEVLKGQASTVGPHRCLLVRFLCKPILLIRYHTAKTSPTTCAL